MCDFMQRTIKSENIRQREIDRKNIALQYFGLVSQGKFKEGLRFFSSDCKTHNPFIAGNMDVLTDAMNAANTEGSSKYPEAEFAVKNVLADGDLVAVHTQLLSKADSCPNQDSVKNLSYCLRTSLQMGR